MAWPENEIFGIWPLFLTTQRAFLQSSWCVTKFQHYVSQLYLWPNWAKSYAVLTLQFKIQHTIFITPLVWASSSVDGHSSCKSSHKHGKWHGLRMRYLAFGLGFWLQRAFLQSSWCVTKFHNLPYGQIIHWVCNVKSNILYS